MITTINEFRMLIEGMIKGLDLPSNIGLVPTQEYLVLYDFDKDEDEILGIISLSEMDGTDIQCIHTVAAEKGYGPLMYEMAMSYVPSHKIIADRHASTSPAALNVYRKMYERGLGVETIEPGDRLYREYPNAYPEDNEILNTVFQYDDQKTLQYLLKNAEDRMSIYTNKTDMLNFIASDATSYFYDRA